MGCAGEHAQLRVVERDAVDGGDRFEQLLASVVDPEVHRVECDEARAAALLAHPALQRGLDVREKERAAGAGGGGELGLEVLEDAQAGLVGVGGVEVAAVVAPPEERLSAATRSIPSMSIPRRSSTESSCSEKSSPTGPITWISVKNEAASEKCTAVPPSIRSRLPNGVLTLSNAIEPTTVSDTGEDPIA